MKKIEALIKPYHLEQIKSALMEVGIRRMTATEVKGFGRQPAHTEMYRSREYTVDFLPNIKIEVVVPDEELDRALKAITRPGKPGKEVEDDILISNIEQPAWVRPVTAAAA